MSSGLYEEATERGLLISHKEVNPEGIGHDSGTVLLPDQLKAISYPYEWCFSQLKSAAILVLDLQELALTKGMTLKDATAYNVQFVDGKPLFIDTSSFEHYQEGTVWVAYRQFCQHFLAPLLLMSRVDVRLGRTLESYIDGIPVDLASSMVSKKTWLNPWLYMHIGLHAKAQKSRNGGTSKAAQMQRSALLGLLKSLRQAVESLKWEDRTSQWSDYSSADSYDQEASRHKAELVESFLADIPEKPSLVWDLGANAGEFSRIFSSKGILTVAWDGDAAAVERNQRQIVESNQTHLLPLVQDFSNPSPALGWQHQERYSFLERGPADLSVALALIHHLVIGNSVPFERTADFLSKTGRYLIIEFVGPDDPRVTQLMSSRTDSHDYNQEAFETAFAGKFDILQQASIQSSSRSLYLMRRKDA